MTRAHLFRILYIVWALPCIAACVVLLQATEGHPPGIVFLPFAIGIWVIGHLLLWGTRRLVERGVASKNPAWQDWPPSIVVAIIGSGIASFLGVLLLGRIGIDQDQWQPWNLIVLGVLLAHVPAFVGLLLRKTWARVYAAILAASWALLMTVQLVDHLMRGSAVRLWEWPVAITIILACATLAALLSRRQPAGTDDR